MVEIIPANSYKACQVFTLCVRLIIVFLLLNWFDSCDGANPIHKKPLNVVVKAPKEEVRKPEEDKFVIGWLSNSCLPLKRLINKKYLVMSKLQNLIFNIQLDKGLTQEEKKYQSQTFLMLAKELNETEWGVYDSLVWLRNVLSGDFKDLVTLKEKSKTRLDWLKNAVVQEQGEYQVIEEAEVGLERVNKTHVEGLMNSVLEEVSKSADNLEDSLNENIFKDAAENLAEKNGAGGGDIETVIRVRDNPDEPPHGQEKTSKDQEQAQPEDEVIKFVDSKDNMYVLSKGSDSTVPHEDSQLIKDIIVVTVVSTLFGWLCTLVSLPTMFGYVLTGVFLGPSGLSWLKSLVQLETLGEFGIFFILFSVGLEFSPAQLKKVLKVSLVGTSTLSLSMVSLGVLVGALTDSSLTESGFVAACLSLSSTPLVVKFLSSHSGHADGGNHSDYGTLLLGVLIMQDVFLGLLVAALPVLASTASSKATDSHWQNLLLTYGSIALRLTSALTLVLGIAMATSQFAIGQLYSYLLKQSSKEMLVMVTVVLAMITLSFTHYLNISMELGCFITGVMVSSQGSSVSTPVEHVIQPIKDFLASLFFASIGLHIFPQFLAYQFYVTTTLTLFLVTTKFILSVLILATLTRRSSSSHVKWVVSAGLAQVSEFSFVLCSRARRLGLVSREVYLLILGVTTMSLLFAPVLWRVTLFRLHIKPRSTARSPSASDDTNGLYGQVAGEVQEDLEMPAERAGAAGLPERDL